MENTRPICASLAPCSLASTISSSGVAVDRKFRPPVMSAMSRISRWCHSQRRPSTTSARRSGRLITGAGVNDVRMRHSASAPSTWVTVSTTKGTPLPATW